jgi:S1-C subfamily serine protease
MSDESQIPGQQFFDIADAAATVLPESGFQRRRWVAGGVVLVAALGVTGWGVTAALAGGTATGGFPHVSRLSAGSSVDPTAAEAAVNNAVVDIDATDGYAGQEDAGTGMVVTSDGDVLTNNHVVADATAVSVTVVATGRTYQARVLGTDATDDVALLKLSGASGLDTIPVGDAGSATQGIAVAAVGNALGRAGAPTVTTGSITGTGRSITASDGEGAASENLTGMLETDADIVSGDSGGPLVDSGGQVIGMDTAANAGSNGSGFETAAITSSDDGFAIPITKALGIARQIASGRSSSTVVIGTPGFLGVELGSSSEGASALTVVGVVPNGPAEQAGLAAGDTLISLDGRTLSSAGDLTAALDADSGGDRASVGWTDQTGAAHAGTVTLADGPAA